MLKRKCLKKILSVLCVMCIVFSMFAGETAVFAEESDMIEATSEQTDDEKANNENQLEEQEEEAILLDNENEMVEETVPAEETVETVIESEPESNVEVETTTSADSTPQETVEAVTVPQSEATSEQIEELSVQEEEPSSESEEAPAVSRRAPSRAGSTDLANVLREVVIDAPTDDDGNYIINPNSSYELTLYFQENSGAQIADESTLTYDFPAGIQVNDIGRTSFSIAIRDDDGAGTVEGNIYEIVNNQLRVYLNQNDPNFERLTNMSNVSFNISMSSKLDQGVEQISFNGTIIKNFVYDLSADLEINKSVVYDMDTDTASYTVTIKSLGENENVVIEDDIHGSALTLNRDVAIVSDKNGSLSVTPDYSSGRGFSVTIPKMQDQETITLTYTASVDNTKISANGTVDQTENTARVKSDQVEEWKEAKADFHNQANFQRVKKEAVGDPEKLDETHYKQTWKILVNQDHKINMGGTYISDWIVDNSRPYMTFADEDDGIRVLVTLENGTIETRDISWSELKEYTNSTGRYGWAYLVPETDGKASYEITCTTSINTIGALGELTLENGAQIFSSYSSASVKIGQTTGENDFDIQKIGVKTTSAESEWEIVITVPGSGLSELHVTDDCPLYKVDETTSYIDFIDEASFTVKGLIDDESWEVRRSTSNERSFTITFYKTSTQDDVNKGVLPTADGNARTITISYKTTVNQDWLDLASESGYTPTDLYRHRNYARIWSGSYSKPTVNADVYPIKPTFQKNFLEREDVEIDGVTYPMFRYYLTMSGSTADGIVIQDAFDTEHLKFYEAEGVKIQGGMTTTPTSASGTASAVATEAGVDITVSSFPKKDDGDFYPFYQITYGLIVKDPTALAALNAAAAESSTGIELENTASWDDLSDSTIVNYTHFPYVDKELLTNPTLDNGYVAGFQVVINRYAEDLDPAADELVIQDVLSSNLRFLPDSITISPSINSIVTQYDADTNTITFTGVPDETAITITYQARVLGKGEVTYSNTIKYGKYEKTIEQTMVITTSGGGTASNPSITLVKRDAEDYSTTLAGATFQLYTVESGNTVPVTDNNGAIVTFTTGADGKVLIVGNERTLGWTLWQDQTYCLIETAAPSGFELNMEPTYFVLTESPSTQIEFDITGEQLSVQDEPSKTELTVEKRWIGAGLDAVTVELLADGTKVAEAELSADNNWQYTFEGLNQYKNGVLIKYEVKEPELEEYAVSILYNDDDSVTITNTNIETISIPVVKSWIGPAGDSVTINLKADGEVIGSQVLTAEDNWEYIFTNLPKYDSVDGHEIHYELEEDPVPGYYQSDMLVGEPGYVFVNTNDARISVPVSKTWIGPGTDAVTVTLTADGETKDTVELNDNNNWSYTFTDLPQYDSTDGHEIVYDVIEASLEGYSSERDGTVATGFTFTNTNTATISIPVSKNWIGPAADSVTINLTADGTVVATMALSAINHWNDTFTDLPKYDSTDGHEIAYDVTEASVEGYQISRSGTVETGFIFTNTNTAKISVHVTKQWVGGEAESATINLFADGVKVSDIVLNKANNWQYAFTPLPKYDSTDGHEILYTITENAVDGYTANISGNMRTGFVITNTKTTTTNPPRTGDDSNSFLYLLTTILSGVVLIGVIAVLVYRRRTRRSGS